MTIEDIKQKHTKVDNMDGGYVAYLIIDHQSFRVCEVRPKQEADWFAEQLAIALKRIMK